MRTRINAAYLFVQAETKEAIHAELYVRACPPLISIEPCIRATYSSSPAPKLPSPSPFEVTPTRSGGAAVPVDRHFRRRKRRHPILDTNLVFDLVAHRHVFSQEGFGVFIPARADLLYSDRERASASRRIPISEPPGRDFAALADAAFEEHDVKFGFAERRRDLFLVTRIRTRLPTTSPPLALIDSRRRMPRAGWRKT